MLNEWLKTFKSVFYILFPLSYFIYSSYLYSVLKGIVNPLISEQFNLFTKESNIAVKQIRETSVIYCRIIRRHENNSLLYLHVLLLPTIVLTRRIHCSRIPSSHGLRMSNWETNRFPKLTLLINSVCAGWLKTIFSSETFFWCYPTTRIYSCKAALNYTTQIKTRTMHWRAVITIFIRFGGFWFSQLFFLLISPFFSLLSWRDWRQVTFSVHIC